MTMRFDLAFFLCCCKSFLGSDDEGEDFYALLGVDRTASADDIKKAFKRQSLQLHPDKLAQRGIAVTPEHQMKFTRMKEAYETLSDPHQRETYDAVGAKGLKWIEEPLSVDPQELAHNFATSSVLDRSKIFFIFVFIAVAVLVLPLLICWKVDGFIGGRWMLILLPLWIWDAVILLYHVRVIMMGPIPRPDHIPPEEWVDPLPMRKRYFSLVRFALIVLFEVLVVLKLDEVVYFPWTVIFAPLFIWEATTIYKKYPLARMRIVTVQDLENVLGKPFSDFSPAEKELIGQRYSVVPSIDSPDFEAAQRLKTRARQDIAKSIVRVIFGLVLLMQLDLDRDWNWWLVFLPFWLMIAMVCYANYQAFVEVQEAVIAKDPTLLGLPPRDETANNYGAVNEDGTTQSPLSEEEREELKAQLFASSSKLCSKCCSQGLLLFIMALFVAKLQGAGFSSVWIMSPFLLAASLILCCLGCAIFGITEVPTDGINFDPPPSQYSPPEDVEAPAATEGAAASTSTNTQQTQEATNTVITLGPPPVDDTTGKAPEEIHELD